ncbi:MAG: hypothetical protein ABFS19_00145 [Thermodesulfobacteriota bacterium]
MIYGLDFPHRLNVVFNGWQVTVRAQTPELAEPLHDLFFHLLSDDPGSSEILLELHLRRIGDEFFELEEYGKRHEQGPLSNLLHHVREWVTDSFVSACPELLWLHAGGAAYEGRAVLLPGQSGVGKSSLTAGLVDRGCRYLTDDIVPLDPSLNCVVPFPFPPSVRRVSPENSGGWGLFLRQQKDDIRISSDQVSDEPIPVNTLIFPEYLQGVSTGVLMEEVSTMTATRLLLSQCVRYDAEKEQTISRLLDLSRSARCFRLVYDNPEQALSAIERVAADGGR